MLGVKTYTQDYIDNCRARIQLQLSTYQATISQRSTSDAMAIANFEAEFFNNMLLVLDYLFVHRLRGLEKKDGNPLNEVRILCDSLLLNNGKLLADKQIRLDPAKSILGYNVGDEITLNQTDFARLSGAFFAEIESKFGE